MSNEGKERMCETSDLAWLGCVHTAEVDDAFINDYFDDP